MQQVITQEQASKALGGRNPFDILPYREALKKLDECMDFDEARAFINLGDAAKAWGKVYREKEVIRKGRALILHAFERMGVLGGMARKSVVLSNGGQSGIAGRTPGPQRWLEQHGMSRTEAQAARRLAKMPKNEFLALVNSPKPPAPVTAAARHPQSMWVKFCIESRIYFLRSAMSKTNPREAASWVEVSDRIRAKEAAVEMSEWLDAFIAALEKKK